MKLDAISVCVPNHLHAEVSIAALDAGLHVLCEKPMALNAGEAEKMVAAAKRSGKFLMMGFNNRFRSDSMAMKKLIGDGMYGDIYFARAGWLRRAGIPGRGSWFTTKAKSGGGALIDIGVHALDLSTWLMGTPEPVSVMGVTYAKFGVDPSRGAGDWGEKVAGGIFDVDDLASAMIRFGNGATLLLEASWASHVERDEMFVELMGTEAGSTTSGTPPRTTIYTERAGITQDITLLPEPQPAGSAHYYEVEQFVRCVQQNRPPTSTGEDGLRIMRILDGIYASAKSGASVKI